MPQTATTGQLANAQERIVASTLYTMEHNAIASQFVTDFTLAKGDDRVIVPKVGRMTFYGLVDGQDIVTEQSVGMTTVTLTAAEVGGKIILTDKLVRQNATTDVYRMIGQQMGDAAARKVDTDIHAIYSSLNGGTLYGAAGATLTLANLLGGVAKGRGKTTDPFNATYAIIHPYQTIIIARSATVIGSTTTRPGNINPTDERALLNKWWRYSIAGVDVMEDGNLTIDSSTDVTGVLAEERALYKLTAKEWSTTRQRDESLRATEVNMVSDYGVGQLNTQAGTGIIYDAATPNDTA